MGYRDRSGSEYPSHVRNTFHKRTRGIEHIGTLTDGIGGRASIKRPRLFLFFPILLKRSTQYPTHLATFNSLSQDSFYTITHFLPQPRKRHNATLHLHLRGRRRPGRLCPGQPRRRQPSRCGQHPRQGCLHYRPRLLWRWNLLWLLGMLLDERCEQKFFSVSKAEWPTWMPIPQATCWQTTSC